MKTQKRFELGKSYRFKTQSVNNKVYFCDKTDSGQLRLFYTHKGIQYSTGLQGFHPEDFIEIKEEKLVDEV